jgi:hypothetical protein
MGRRTAFYFSRILCPREEIIDKKLVESYNLIGANLCATNMEYR